MSIIRQLVSQFLARPGVLTFGDAEARGHALLATLGGGLDHFAGERLLAVIAAPKRQRGDRLTCVAITDLRAWVVDGGAAAWSLPLGEVRHARLEGGRVVVGGAGGSAPLPAGVSRPEVLEFFGALATRPAGVEPMGMPWIAPSAEDPTGASAATTQLYVPDERATMLLHLADDACRAGVCDPRTAHDFASRVLLAHRARVAGPGAVNGQWLSPLSGGDLGICVGHVLDVIGEPFDPRDGTGAYGLDFQVEDEEEPEPPPSALETLSEFAFDPLGTALDHLEGTRGDGAPDVVRAVFADAPFGSRYQLFLRNAPMNRVDPRWVADIQADLREAAYEALLLRILFGWQPSVQALLELGDAEIDRAVASRAGGAYRGRTDLLSWDW